MPDLRELFRVRLICKGIPTDAAQAGADCITQEFVSRRKWHESAACFWESGNLILEVVNDFDENGLATQDEFSDMISGCFVDPGQGDLWVDSVVAFWTDKPPVD